MPEGPEDTFAHEPKLNSPVIWRSEAEQGHEALKTIAQLLTLLGLKLAHQGFLELGPVIGEAIADTHATLGEGHTRREFGTDSLAIDQAAIDQTEEPGGQCHLGEAKLGGQFNFGGASATQFKQDGIIAGLKAPLGQRQQQRAVGELTGFDQPIERGTG